MTAASIPQTNARKQLEPFLHQLLQASSQEQRPKVLFMLFFDEASLLSAPDPRSASGLPNQIHLPAHEASPLSDLAVCGETAVADASAVFNTIMGSTEPMPLFEASSTDPIADDD